MRCIALVLLTMATSTAHADGVSNELSAGTSVATSTTPATRWVATRVGGVWDASDAWQVRVSFEVTRMLPSDDTGDQQHVINGGVSADYTHGDHWTFGMSFSGSPASNTFSSATVLAEGLPGDLGEADAQLAARTGSDSFGVTATYDTAGDSDHEQTWSFGVGVNRFAAVQGITSVIDPDGYVHTVEALRERCQMFECDMELVESLSPLLTRLNQFVLEASATHTEGQDTDLSLDAALYLYDSDPTAIGYFSLATIGRGNLGNGIGVAPLRYTLSPSVANRWGALAGTLRIVYAGYADAGGYDLGANLRMQYSFDLADERALAVFTKLGTTLGVDVDNNLTTSLSAGMGARYSW